MRKKQGAADLRKNNIILRISDSELNLIDYYAQNERLDRSEYIRRRAMK
jgi:hypothetical protein